MIRRLAYVLSFLALAVVGSVPANADGDEILGPPTIPIQGGSGVEAAGIGLVGDVGVLQSGDIIIDVPGDVVQVLLYWSGRWRDADAPATSTIEVNGTTVEGPRIGISILAVTPGDQLAAYRQDITDLGLVNSGLNTLTISGAPFANFFNSGAGVFVIFEDSSGDQLTDLVDGHDFAYAFSSDLNEQVTVPRAVYFDPSTSDRTAELSVFVTEVGDFFSTTRFRTSTVQVSLSDGTEVSYIDELQSYDGPVWDTFIRQISIPAGVDSMTIELISEGSDPASLSWLASSLSIEPPDEPVCGDGEVNQPDETCDPPGSTPDDNYPNNICRESCTYCGDGIVNNGEQCDFNDPDAPLDCNAECMIDPYCGDGEVNQPDETCDPPGSTPDDNYPDNICRDSCTYCGDGVVNNGEQCDFNDPSAPANCNTMCMLDEIGDDGCTPGFWRTPQHFSAWTGYSPGQSFASVFDRTITVRTKGGQATGQPYTVTGPTLLEAVWATGGDVGALARHAVAALLNAANPDVSYVYSAATIISMFQNAYDSGDYEMTKNMLAMENERDCPIDGQDSLSARSTTRRATDRTLSSRQSRGPQEITTPSQQAR